ncbi:MAG: hypothetical protein ACJ75S_01240 [Solirubrobacterales bacterium]
MGDGRRLGHRLGYVGSGSIEEHRERLDDLVERLCDLLDVKL